MLLVVALLLLPQSSEENRPLSFVIREHVYMAEVYGRWEDGINALQHMWLYQTEKEDRRRIVRAISLIKGGLPRNRDLLTMADLEHDFAPRGLMRFGMPALLVKDLWLEPGDWIDNYFVLDIEAEALVLERRDGFTRQFPLPAVPAPVNAALTGADVRSILTFICRRQGLNAFVPSQIEQTVSGEFLVDDWLTFMDDICRLTGMIWIRRSGNVIFNLRGATEPHLESEMIKSVDSRNQSLNTFLQNIAVTFDLELMLDEDLADVSLDILLTQDQSWDEVLECLSIMNNFSWFVIRETGERSRLVIQKDREE